MKNIIIKYNENRMDFRWSPVVQKNKDLTCNTTGKISTFRNY